MKRTEIPAVKVWASQSGDRLNVYSVDESKFFAANIPCILRTAAADKLILDVVREAANWRKKSLGYSEFEPEAFNAKPGQEKLISAVQRLENAGVKL